MHRSPFVVFTMLVGSACGGSEMRGVIVETLAAADEGPPVPLAGVEVCIDGARDTCTESDDEGRYSVRGFPADGDVAVTFKKEDHVDQLYLRLGNPFDVEFDTALTSDALYSAFFANTASPLVFPLDDGIVWVNEDSNADGVTAELVSDGEGPYYSQDGRRIDVQATGTTADGLGFIFFNRVPPGDATVRIVPSSSSPPNCEQDRGGWRGDDEGTIRVPVRAATETLVVTKCR